MNKDSLDWKNIEGEIVFSIANIFVEKYTKSEDMTEPKSIICVAKEILVREIMDERSYFNIPVGEDSDNEGGKMNTPPTCFEISFEYFKGIL